MSFIKAVLTEGEQLLEWANKWHQTIVFWTIVGAVFVLALGVLTNLAGFPRFNFVLAAITLLAGIFFLTKPALVLSVVGIGSLTSGLPDIKLGEILRNGVGSLPNFELKKILGSGWGAIKATTHKVAHALFLLTVILIVLGTFPISDPALVLPALVVLTGFGLWTVLFIERNGARWYRRITIGILLIAGGTIFFKMYDHKSKVERIEEARVAHQEALIDEGLTPILRKSEHGVKLTEAERRTLEKARDREENRSIVKKVGHFFTDGEQDVTINSLEPVKICGLPSGSKRFVIDGGEPLIVILMPDETSPTGMTATRTDARNDPLMGIAVKSNGRFVRDGGLVKFSEECSTIQLMVPPDTKMKLSSGDFVLSPLTVRIRFK